MRLPFTAEQFFAVFREYNEAVWPAQAILLALALVSVVLVFLRRSWCGPAISVVLALLWTWLAFQYHFRFFSRINGLAFAFGGLAVVEAGLLIWHGAIHRRLRFASASRPRIAMAGGLVAFALVIYPLWSALSGHPYPTMPTFGLPCPTTIFTLGTLGFLVPPYPRGPLLIPIAWCAIGGQAAFLLAVPQDLGLLVAGLFGLGLLVAARTPVAGSRIR